MRRMNCLLSLTFIGAFLMTPSLPVSAAAPPVIAITLSGRMFLSTDRHIVQVRDLGCSSPSAVLTYTVVQSSRIGLNLCKSGAGYGRLGYRNASSNGQWVASSLLSDGAIVDAP